MAEIFVPVGGNLQAAIDNALPGDDITLQPGGYYEGNWVLRNKGSSTSYITIRSRAPEIGGYTLPATGYRIQPKLNPAHATALPRLRGRQLSSWRTTACIGTDSGAHHWRLQWLEFDSQYWGASNIVRIGNNNHPSTAGAQLTYADQPHHITFDQIWMHGDPWWGQKFGLILNGYETDVLNSYFSDIKGFPNDSVAVGGSNGQGPIRVINCYIECSTENFILGGADPIIKTIAQISTSPAPTQTSARINTIDKLLVGTHLAIMTAAGTVLRFSTCRSITPVSGSLYDITFDSIGTLPDAPGDIRWGVGFHDLTFRRNYVVKKPEWRNPFVPPPTGLTATPSTASGSLSAGTYTYHIVTHIISTEGSVARSVPISISSSLSGTGRISLNWNAPAGSVPVLRYRIYRRTPAGVTGYYDHTTTSSWIDDGLTVFTTSSDGNAITVPSSGSRWQVKCIFELKQIIGAQIDSNIFENSWIGATGTSQAVWLKSNNQSGNHKWAQCCFVTIEKNLFRHVPGFTSNSGRRASSNSLRDLPEAVHDLIIRNNLVYDSNGDWSLDGSTIFGDTIQNGSYNILFDHNTVLHYMRGTLAPATNASIGYLTNIRWTNNILVYNTYGVKGASNLSLAEGIETLRIHSQGDYVFNKNVLGGNDVGNSIANYTDPDHPEWTNYHPSLATFETQFKHFSPLARDGDFRLKRISEGDNINSLYINQATDGTDIGCDIGLLMNAIEGVIEGFPEGEGDGEEEPEPPPPPVAVSARTLFLWTALDAIGTDTPAASLDIRGTHQVMSFPDGQVTSATFDGVMPRTYLGGRLDVTLYWSASVIGDPEIEGVVWGASLERMEIGHDLAIDDFGSEKTVISAPEVVSGIISRTRITLESSDLQGILAGESFRLKIRRTGTDLLDNVVGDTELMRVELGTP